MNRDELILSCENCVKRLVRKYNNGCDDEDLQKVYAKYGFSISESNKNYMLLTLNKKEEK